MKIYSALFLFLLSHSAIAHDSQLAHSHSGMEYLLALICIAVAALFFAKK